MIDRFKNEHQFLSNFYWCQIRYKKRIYPSAEHLFQALKTTDGILRNTIRRLSTPTQAKHFGRTLTLRDKWEQIKDHIMYEVVRMKFSQNECLAVLLLNTRGQELVEGNWWHDNYWGDCYCDKCKKIEGANQLGKILMKIRKETVART